MKNISETKIKFFGSLLLGLFVLTTLSSCVYAQKRERIADTGTNKPIIKAEPVEITKTANLKHWSGEYKFETGDLLSAKERKQNNVGPVPEHVYTLRLSEGKKSDSLNCYFLASGVQLYDEFDCSIKLLGNNLQIFFIKDTTGKEAEFIPYKKGQLLFTLQTPNGSTGKHLYQSAAYKIYLPQGTNKNIFFTISELDNTSEVSDLNAVNLRIKGIGLGSSYQDMEKQFGKPLETKKAREYGCYDDELEMEITNTYSGVIIKLLQGDTNKLFVSSIEVTSPEIMIMPEIQIGISPKAMEMKLGKSEPLGKEEGYELFTYVNKDNNGSATFYFKTEKLMKVIWVSETC